jgi:hypothetical protein
MSLTTMIRRVMHPLAILGAAVETAVLRHYGATPESFAPASPEAQSTQSQP